MAATRYIATKEGFDGRKIIKPGEIFFFSGKRGTWMVPCDEKGNPLQGEALPPPERPVRAGASQPKGKTRGELREECTRLGIKYSATLGAQDLAALIVKHNEGIDNSTPEPPGDNPPGGTGEQNVL